MPRHKDSQWNLNEEGTPNASGEKSYSNDTIKLALLMDLRDELKQLNQTLSCLRCTNFLAMPRHVERTRLAVEGLRRDAKTKRKSP